MRFGCATFFCMRRRCGFESRRRVAARGARFEPSVPRLRLSLGGAAMSFNAQTYRVLIASPSDLTDERQAVTDAINEWNAEHASAEGVVLLPVRWETHARPARL